MTGTAQREEGIELTLTLEYPFSTTSYGSDTFTFDIINPREHFLVDIHASGAAFAGTYPNATLTSVTITLLGNIAALYNATELEEQFRQAFNQSNSNQNSIELTLTLEYPSLNTVSNTFTFDIPNPRDHFLVDIHASGAAFARTYPNATLTAVTITLLGNLVALYNATELAEQFRQAFNQSNSHQNSSVPSTHVAPSP
jgi:hypothetical protein